MNIYFDTEFMGAKKMEESDICQVDLYVKSALVTDTILLAKKRFDTIKETDSFRGLHRIHPLDGEPDPENEGEEVYHLIQ